MSAVSARAVVEFRRRAFVRLFASATYDGTDPLKGWHDHESLWEVFADQDDLLASLQEHWVALLSHRIFAESTYPLGNDSLRDAYAEVAREHSALHAVLDAHADDPAIADSVLEEHVFLARAAGHLDRRASASTLAWRTRDLLATIPSQRVAETVDAS